MQAVETRPDELGVAPACQALVVPRATFYRWRQPQPSLVVRQMPVRALRDGERPEG